MYISTYTKAPLARRENYVSEVVIKFTYYIHASVGIAGKLRHCWEIKKCLWIWLAMYYDVWIYAEMNAYFVAMET